MKRASAFAVVSILLAAGPALAEDVAIDGVQVSRDIDCEGQNVVIAGQGNTISLKGRCGAVQVTGADHRVTFEAAAALQVTGAAITATGGEVGALAVDVTDNVVKATVTSSDAPAEVRIFGADQKSELSFAGPAKVTVGGASNELVWAVDGGVKPPSISAVGVDLRIRKK